MNLLVTNTRNQMAYTIILALRPYASKIVATRYGNVIGRTFSHAANSRYVDKTYTVPSPVRSWGPDALQEENSEDEQRYVAALLDIIEREKIDVLFPSRDAVCLIVSKNKALFERMGVTVPVPDFRTIRTAMDKYALLQKAASAGVPCPRTFLPQCPSDVEEIAAELGFPVVVKPRLSSGSKGLEIAKNSSELRMYFDKCRSKYGLPILQEYIPGYPSSHVKCVYAVTDDSYSVLAEFPYEFVRSIFVNTGSFVSASRWINDPVLVKSNARLLKVMRYKGFSSTDYKMDPRDGVPKLMEINTRQGGRIWTALMVGINFPLITLYQEMGKKVHFSQPRFRPTVFLNPVEEGIGFVSFSIHKFLRVLLHRAYTHPLDIQPSYRSFLKSYVQTWHQPEKFFGDCFRSFLRDPLPGLSQWPIMTSLLVKHLDRYVP